MLAATLLAFSVRPQAPRLGAPAGAPRKAAATLVDAAVLGACLASLALDDAESARLHALRVGLPLAGLAAIAAPLGRLGMSPGLAAVRCACRPAPARALLATLLLPAGLAALPLTLLRADLAGLHWRVARLDVRRVAPPSRPEEPRRDVAPRVDAG